MPSTGKVMRWYVARRSGVRSAPRGRGERVHAGGERDDDEDASDTGGACVTGIGVSRRRLDRYASRPVDGRFRPSGFGP